MGLQRNQVMSSCPHIDLAVGGVTVSCLVDTGSMVSIVTESFFSEHFAPWGYDRLQSCHWLQLRAANSLTIPYIGYFKLGVALCGKLFPNCGILVVRSSWCISVGPWNLGEKRYLLMLPRALWNAWSRSFQPAFSHSGPGFSGGGPATMSPGHKPVVARPLWCCRV